MLKIFVIVGVAVTVVVSETEINVCIATFGVSDTVVDSLTEIGAVLNNHPLLPETFVLFTPAKNFAPPLAVLSCKEIKLDVTFPEAHEIVHALDPVVLCNVIKFPDVPLTFHPEADERVIVLPAKI